MDIKIILQATALSGLMLAGCATQSTVPRDRITSSEAAIKAAEQVKSIAPATPGADHHLKMAREEYAAAHREMKDGRDHRAELLFIRARTDAELASSMCLASRADAEHAAITTELEKIKQAPPAIAPSATLEPSDESTPIIPGSEDDDDREDDT
jgi:hypothetical protein